jgi:hypothetical protein
MPLLIEALTANSMQALANLELERRMALPQRGFQVNGNWL